MLKRVIMNLIGNAYKFTPSKKTITFSVQYEASSQRILISIKDTGIGIAKEKQDEIFITLGFRRYRLRKLRNHFFSLRNYLENYYLDKLTQ